MEGKRLILNGKLGKETCIMRKGIWKKAAACAMAVVMAGSVFAGCGKKDSSSSKNSSSKKSSKKSN